MSGRAARKSDLVACAAEKNSGSDLRARGKYIKHANFYIAEDKGSDSSSFCGRSLNDEHDQEAGSATVAEKVSPSYAGQAAVPIFPSSHFFAT